MKRSIAVCAALLGSVVFGLSGCNKKVSEADSEKISGKLMIYTSSSDEFISDIVNRFNQKYPGMNALYFRSGTEEVMSKINAENQVGNVQADLIMISDFATMESLKSQDMLLSYDSPEIKNINEQYIDKDHEYYGVFPSAIGIIYNTKLVEKAPRSWKDLISESASKSAIMPSPLYSGTACNWLMEMSRAKGFGWDYIKALKANQIKVVKGNGGVVNSVSSGECKYGIAVEGGSVHNAIAKGAPLKFVYPSDGFPTTADPIAILKTTQNLPAAQKFLDFMLQEEVQTTARDKYGRVPVRKGLVLDEDVLPVNKRKLFLTDAKELVAGRESDKAAFSEIFK